MIDIARFGPLDVFQRQVDTLIDFVKTDPLEGEVLYPGEVEARNRRERLANGIDLPAATWNEISACAGARGDCQLCETCMRQCNSPFLRHRSNRK